MPIIAIIITILALYMLFYGHWVEYRKLFFSDENRAKPGGKNGGKGFSPFVWALWLFIMTIVAPLCYIFIIPLAWLMFGTS